MAREPIGLGRRGKGGFDKTVSRFQFEELPKFKKSKFEQKITIKPEKKILYNLNRKERFAIRPEEVSALRTELTAFKAAKSMTVAEAKARGTTVECAILSKRYKLTDIIQVYGKAAVVLAIKRVLDSGFIKK